MIKIAMCDDDLASIQQTAKIIESIIISIGMDAEVVCISDNQSKVFQMIKDKEIDVLFLDIDFRNGAQKDGLSFGKDLRKINRDFYLIFLTAHFKYMGIGYECKTFRYLMKPADRNIFEDCLKDLKEELEFNTNRFCKIGTNIIRLTDIIYIEKDGMKASICTTNETINIYKPLEKLIEMLPHNFIRCHKSYIVNKDKIETINLKDKFILLHNNTTCPIGKKYIKELENEGDL